MSFIACLQIQLKMLLKFKIDGQSEIANQKYMFFSIEKIDS